MKVISVSRSKSEGLPVRDVVADSASLGVVLGWPLGLASAHEEPLIDVRDDLFKGRG
jgi:hypothetical protein